MSFMHFMTYTVHKEGRPFRKCADLNAARECINENGGDGNGAGVAFIASMVSDYCNAIASDDMDHAADIHRLGVDMMEFVAPYITPQEQKDGEQWAIK